MLHSEALHPQKSHANHRRTRGLPQTPAVGGGTQHKEKKQEEQAAASYDEQGHHDRPENVRPVD